ncbi:hypothetical protein VNO77_16827 [Canavalia gladiata]|uniref:Uncharacterized protein n=1 Tax=Canavalia gladiata TaxID=3824 RepID=A0AAN9QIT1_CANGL
MCVCPVPSFSFKSLHCFLTCVSQLLLQRFIDPTIDTKMRIEFACERAQIWRFVIERFLNGVCLYSSFNFERISMSLRI